MKTFNFNGEKYDYFDHPYNTTKLNERTVEIPIVWKFAKRIHNKKILEVGNVLSHYFYVTHEIVDMYEETKNVKNININDFTPKKRYDLIICISTLEHISESIRGITNTFNHLKSLLKIKGKLVITIPIGYNKSVDFVLKEDGFLPSDIFYMKRLDVDNNWKQVNYNEVENLKYSTPFPYANGISIIIFKKE